MLVAAKHLEPHCWPQPVLPSPNSHPWHIFTTLIPHVFILFQDYPLQAGWKTNKHPPSDAFSTTKTAQTHVIVRHSLTTLEMPIALNPKTIWNSLERDKPGECWRNQPACTISSPKYGSHLGVIIPFLEMENEKYIYICIYIYEYTYIYIYTVTVTVCETLWNRHRSRNPIVWYHHFYWQPIWTPQPISFGRRLRRDFPIWTPCLITRKPIHSQQKHWRWTPGILGCCQRLIKKPFLLHNQSRCIATQKGWKRHKKSNPTEKWLC